MPYNQNASYGSAMLSGLSAATTGKTFILCATTFTGRDIVDDLFTPDTDGQTRVFSNQTDAAAATVAGRGDVLYIHPSWTTAITAANTLVLETNNVQVRNLAGDAAGTLAVSRATAVLPATTTGAVFNVNGRVKILSIVGEVTTVIQTQACNTKISFNPTGSGASTDLCANLDVTAAAVGSLFYPDGTFATAMVKAVYLARPMTTPVIVQDGTIDLTTSATNTGSVKWRVEYVPAGPGAFVSAA
jgi:hypothetical protein